MAWVFVCLIAGVIANLTGPGVGAVHLIALGVAAIAFIVIVWPIIPGVGAGFAGFRELLGGARSTDSR